MAEPDPSMTNTAAPPRRRWRWLKFILISLILVLVAAELTCRWWYGLGDPPLYMAHSEVEYLLQPSQTHYRFGNRVSTNAWSMRSDDFPKEKTDARELRILVLGDSVINGGGYTDQSKLATTILQQRLSKALDRPVVVGNASAGSWGPPNLLAYAKTFGLFDADFVIIVLSNEDYGDVPTFEPLSASLPQRSPILALQEVVTRYVPQLLRYERVNEAPLFNPQPDEVAASLDALRDLIDMIKSSGAKVAVALHAEHTEMMNMSYKSGAQAIAGVANFRRTPIIQLNVALSNLKAQNIQPYRDWIHPNDDGQAAIADSLFQWLMSELK